MKTIIHVTQTVAGPDARYTVTRHGMTAATTTEDLDINDLLRLIIRDQERQNRGVQTPDEVRVRMGGIGYTVTVFLKSMLTQLHVAYDQDVFYTTSVNLQRYGGEVDFGCFWRVIKGGPDRARVSWIEESGEVYYTNRYQQHILIGRTRSGDQRLIETLMAGWADACMDAQPVAWVARRLGVCGKSYATIEKAARVFAKLNGVYGAGGGWIYKEGCETPLYQGWSRYGLSLERRGLVVCIAMRYYVVDPRDASIGLPSAMAGR
jgi:hypothetical protein